MQGTAKGRITSSPGEFSDVTARRMEEQFWIGYRRGLNRLRFGKIFAGYEEAATISANTVTPGDVATLEEIARIMGYRFGSKGLSVEEAAVEYKKFLREMEEQ
jgi:hypothetical protein